MKQKDFLVVLCCAILLFSLFAACIFKPADAVSESERRPLKAFPVLSLDTLQSGKFMQEFESYASDQFPLRDLFRSVKAFTSFSLMGQADVNGIYRADGYLSKIEYPLDEASLENAARKFAAMYNKYMDREDVRVFYSVIPDKNYFLAAPNGYLSMDYDAMLSDFGSRMDFASYIDIFDSLELSDYYRTDTHWRQERLIPTAQALLRGMGQSGISHSYSEVTLEKPFYGVYHGQSALRIPGEELIYLQNDLLQDCTVYDYETNQTIAVYDLEKGQGRDPYELYLSGSKSLLRIDNPHAGSNRKLILFRDSFGSSIAPLLADNYSQVYLVDIRYISASLLSNWIEFTDCDCLFLYSSLVLNNSITFKS